MGLHILNLIIIKYKIKVAPNRGYFHFKIYFFFLGNYYEYNKLKLLFRDFIDKGLIDLIKWTLLNNKNYIKYVSNFKIAFLEKVNISSRFS